jgi:hypothetical protein
MQIEEKWPESHLSPGTLSLIAGRELLIEHLGHWPTFQDFEVVSIHLERAATFAASHGLRATFFVFDLQKAPGDPDRKQGLAELQFEDVADLKIEGFNHQNPILGVEIKALNPSDGQPSFGVKWGGTCMHHEVSFICGRISVIRVVDLNPFRKPNQFV